MTSSDFEVCGAVYSRGKRSTVLLPPKVHLDFGLLFVRAAPNRQNLQHSELRSFHPRTIVFALFLRLTLCKTFSQSADVPERASSLCELQ
jgi:hypothetical protein